MSDGISDQRPKMLPNPAEFLPQKRTKCFDNFVACYWKIRQLRRNSRRHIPTSRIDRAAIVGPWNNLGHPFDHLCECQSLIKHVSRIHTFAIRCEESAIFLVRKKLVVVTRERQGLNLSEHSIDSLAGTGRLFDYVTSGDFDPNIACESQKAY